MAVGGTNWGAVVRNSEGSLLPMAAGGMLVMAALIGGGVDMSRAYKAQTRLQAACDAGVLAGRKAVKTNGFDNAVKDEARAYFNNNFNAAEQKATGTTFTPTSPDNGNTVLATASANIPTAVMAIFSYTQIPVSVNCSASMGVGNSDVTMVLDTTGSMNDALTAGGERKIAMLRTAMKNFYDTVQGSVAGGNARIRYAFVPYSQSINVGRLIYNLNPAYLVDRRTIQSREAVDVKREKQVFDHWGPPVITYDSGESAESVATAGVLNDTEYTGRNACTNSLPANTGWSASGAPTTQTDVSENANGQRVTTITTTTAQTRSAYTCIKQTKKVGNKTVTYYSPYVTVYQRAQYAYRYETQDPVMVTEMVPEFSHYVYKPVSYDVSGYKTFAATVSRTGDDGANVTSTWAGCIEERQTTPAASFGFNRITGITPNSAIDLDIDTAPGSSDSTKWSPLWPEVSYYRTSWVATGPGRGRYDLANNADSLTGGKTPTACPQKAQLLQTMSKAAFDAYADSLYPAGNTYHDLGILWGGRVSSPQGLFSSTVNAAPANGGNVSRHIIFMTDGAMMPSNGVYSTYGIEFHDRRVTANGVNLQSARHTSRFLALCEAVKAKGIRLWVIAFSTGLSDDLETCASNNSAFTAEDADQLNDAFQEIAKEVGELRITQ